MRMRSLLFVPGDKPELLEKARKTGADALIIDLEDAVAVSRKAQARDATAAFLRRPLRTSPLLVRVNPLQSGWTDDDLAAVADARPDGWVLPKAEGAESIREFERRLGAGGFAVAPVLPLASETPIGVFRLGEYAAVARLLLGVSWGAEDLPAAIGATTAREPDGRFTAPYEMVRSLTLFAAHAAGVPAIETVYPAFRDLEGLTAYVARAVRDGFTGMLAIHPAQVSIINAAFTPSDEAVARARRIVDAFAAHPNAGVLDVDGAMVDAPHLKQAMRVLAAAESTHE